MNGYAALLRGIGPTNPNMRNERLRAVVAGLGFTEVQSVLSSGNLVFRGPEDELATIEDRIQQALQAELEIPGGTIVRTIDELSSLLERDPFAGLTHSKQTYLTVTFLKHAVDTLTLPDDPIARVIGYDRQARALLAVVDNSDPKTPAYMAQLDRMYGKDLTTRTWLTVQRIVARAAKSSSGR